MIESPLAIMIVDDEPLAAANLRAKVCACEPDAVVSTITDSMEALKRMSATPPDIAFIDIEMPRLTGFDLVQNLPDGRGPKTVIFCTAHPEHALEAYAHEPLDYIVKPVGEERLKVALERAKIRLQEKAALTAKQQFLHRIVVNTIREKVVLDLTTVECFVSEEHQTVAYLERKEFICDLSLSELEARLDPTVFVRCHRSAIVNLGFIKSVDRTQSTILTLSGRELPVSRRQRAELLKCLKPKG